MNEEDAVQALADLKRQCAEIATTDQEEAHVAHDAGLVVTYYQTLKKGGLPAGLVNGLTATWQDYVLGYHARFEEGDE